MAFHMGKDSTLGLRIISSLNFRLNIPYYIIDHARGRVSTIQYASNTVRDCHGDNSKSPKISESFKVSMKSENVQKIRDCIMPVFRNHFQAQKSTISRILAPGRAVATFAQSKHCHFHSPADMCMAIPRQCISQPKEPFSNITSAQRPMVKLDSKSELPPPVTHSPKIKDSQRWRQVVPVLLEFLVITRIFLLVKSM